MPTSATGISARHPQTRCRRPAAGFTLIEILVVIVIAGILAAAAVLSMAGLGGDQERAQEARRFQALVDLAVEEAVMQSKDLGIQLSRHGYRFLLFDYTSGKWQPPAADELLRPRELPDGVFVDLDVEAQPISLAESLEEPPAPQVTILSSGEVTPFAARFRRDGGEQDFEVEADALARVSFATIASGP